MPTAGGVPKPSSSPTMRNVTVAIAGGGASGTLLAAALVRRSDERPRRHHRTARPPRRRRRLLHRLHRALAQRTRPGNDRISGRSAALRSLAARERLRQLQRALVRSAPRLRGIPRHHRRRDPARRPRHPRTRARHRRRTSRERRARNVLQRRVPRSRDPRSRIGQCSTRVVAAHFRGSKTLAPLFFGSAWDEGALVPGHTGEDVLLLGTGLTAVDAVLGLRQNGHRGTISMVSRRGLLPHEHRLFDTPPAACPDAQTARDLLGSVRATARDVKDQKANWRPAVDGVRPATNALWQALTLADQRQFVRHVMPYWNVHRHRMAPEVAKIFAELIARDALRMLAGRTGEIVESTGGLNVPIRLRGEGETITVHAGRVINCSGPEHDFRKLDNPLIQRLLAQGLMSPYPAEHRRASRTRRRVSRHRRHPLNPPLHDRSGPFRSPHRNHRHPRSPNPSPRSSRSAPQRTKRHSNCHPERRRAAP